MNSTVLYADFAGLSVPFLKTCFFCGGLYNREQKNAIVSSDNFTLEKHYRYGRFYRLIQNVAAAANRKDSRQIVLYYPRHQVIYLL